MFFICQSYDLVYIVSTMPWVKMHLSTAVECTELSLPLHCISYYAGNLAIMKLVLVLLLVLVWVKKSRGIFWSQSDPVCSCPAWAEPDTPGSPESEMGQVIALLFA